MTNVQASQEVVLLLAALRTSEKADILMDHLDKGFHQDGQREDETLFLSSSRNLVRTQGLNFLRMVLPCCFVGHGFGMVLAPS